MPNYSRGKIYYIICNTTGLKYIGSTTKEYLSQRLQGHLSDYKRFLKGDYHFITSFKVLEHNNYEIVLIETFPCVSKDELHARERFHIQSNEYVNKVIPTRTSEEYNLAHKQQIAQKNKEYRLANKQRLAQKDKEYRLAKIEEIALQKKAYRLANKQEIAQKDKEYRLANKQRLAQKDKEYYLVNKEEIARKRYEYRLANKERLAQKDKERYLAKKAQIAL